MLLQYLYSPAQIFSLRVVEVIGRYNFPKHLNNLRLGFKDLIAILGRK
jgi:hypothetical protein